MKITDEKLVLEMTNLMRQMRQDDRRLAFDDPKRQFLTMPKVRKALDEAYPKLQIPPHQFKRAGDMAKRNIFQEEEKLRTQEMPDDETLQKYMSKYWDYNVKKRTVPGVKDFLRRAHPTINWNSSKKDANGRTLDDRLKHFFTGKNTAELAKLSKEEAKKAAEEAKEAAKTEKKHYTFGDLRRDLENIILTNPYTAKVTVKELENELRKRGWTSIENLKTKQKDDYLLILDQHKNLLFRKHLNEALQTTAFDPSDTFPIYRQKIVNVMQNQFLWNKSGVNAEMNKLANETIRDRYDILRIRNRPRSPNSPPESPPRSRTPSPQRLITAMQRVTPTDPRLVMDLTKSPDDEPHNPTPVHLPTTAIVDAVAGVLNAKTRHLSLEPVPRGLIPARQVKSASRDDGVQLPKSLIAKLKKDLRKARVELGKKLAKAKLAAKYPAATAATVKEAIADVKEAKAQFEEVVAAAQDAGIPVPAAAPIAPYAAPAPAPSSKPFAKIGLGIGAVGGLLGLGYLAHSLFGGGGKGGNGNRNDGQKRRSRP